MDSGKSDIKPNVLIVDDNKINLSLLKAILAPLNVIFVEALSGAEAINKIKDTKIALALLDINMPQMDGVELSSIIQNDPAREKIPIIFVTAYPKNETELERIYKLGAVDFIQKPFNKKILLSKVEIFLELWRQRQKIEEQKLNIEKTANDLKEQKNSLSKRFTYEHLLSNISAMAVETDELEDFINTVLKLLGEKLNLCRSCIFEHQHETNTMSIIYEWCEAGVDSLKEVLHNVDCSAIPNWIDTLKNRETICYADVNDIHDELVREVLCPKDVKAIVAIPLFFENYYHGFIGFNDCRKNREWEEEEIEFLLSISRILMTVTKRKQFEEELNQTQLLLRSSLESPKDIVIVSIDKEYRHMYFNEAHRLAMKNAYNIDVDVGVNVLESITNEKDREVARHNFDIALSGKPLVTTQEFGDVDRITYENSYNPIKNDKNEIVGMTLFAQDITQRKQTEDDLKDSLEQLHQLTKYVEKVREQERVNIARELHDDLGQALTAIKIDLGIIRHGVIKEEIVQRIIKTEALVSSTIKTVQKITFQLRPKIIDDLGLEAGIDWYISEFSERHNIAVNSYINSEIDVSQEVSITVFRIMQESLTNVARHAKASKVNIELNQSSDNINLLVRDNGIGIEESKLKSKTSFGILGMKERAEFLDGKLELYKNKAGGTTLELSIPIKNT